MSLCMKKNIITTIIIALTFIVTIFLVFVNAYALQQQQQQQQGQATPLIVQNTSKSMQEPSPGNESQQTPKLDIKRSGSQPSTKGPGEYFTSTVRIDPLFQAKDPARAVGASVTFEPSARTAWHTHPLGQTLIVTSGCGLVQVWGDPVEKICPGDVVWIPPNEKHWHGATPTTAMTHIAIQEQLDGKVVDWMEKVSDEQYRITKTHYKN
jgi:quercetin dioxygenase-like cupin family protein